MRKRQRTSAGGSDLLFAVLAHGSRVLALAGRLIACILGALVVVVACLGCVLALARCLIAGIDCALLAVITNLGLIVTLALLARANLALI